MSEIIYLRPNDRADGYELCVMGDPYTVIPLSRASLLRLMEESSAAVAQTIRNERAGCKCSAAKVGREGDFGVLSGRATDHLCGND